MWNRHTALSLMALHFILQIQRDRKEDIPLISVPDIKLIFAEKLQNNLNSDEGLINAIMVRHIKRKQNIDRHFKVPK